MLVGTFLKKDGVYKKTLGEQIRIDNNFLFFLFHYAIYNCHTLLYNNMYITISYILCTTFIYTKISTYRDNVYEHGHDAWQ